MESRMGVPLDVPVEQTELGTPGGLTVSDAGPMNSAGGVDEIRSFGKDTGRFCTGFEVCVFEKAMNNAAGLKEPAPFWAILRVGEESNDHRESYSRIAGRSSAVSGAKP